MPISVKPAGRATETRPLDWKAPAPISAMPDGSESELSAVQLRNAFVPMRRRLEGSEMVVRLLHPENALLST